MSPKRPISTQRTDLHTDRHTDLHTGATADHTPATQPKHPPTDAAKGTGRDAGSTHDTGIDDADDVAAASPTHAGRVAPDLTHHVGAAGHEASAAVTSAAARVLGTHEKAADVFDPSSKLDARAGRAQGERDALRDRARHGVQDDAADGDGTTGIVDQGTDGVAAEPAKHHAPAVPSSSPADMAEAKRLFEAELARTSDRHVFDPDSDDPTQRVHADEVDDLLLQGTLIPLEPLSDDPLVPPPPDPAPVKGTGTGAHSVDPEHQHDLDPSKAHLTGLDDFLDDLHGTTVAGGGNTDPVDDDGFGSGAVISSPAVVGAAGNSLLTGGDTRGSEIGSGGAGHLPVDVGGHAGAVDAGPDADLGFGGAGLEDDPFDRGPGPSLGLDGARAGANADDDTDDDTDTDTDTDDADADV